VGLTGVIYAVIVVGWAVFLVPLALRRHDQAARNRSIEKFSSAMRVLSHRRSEDGRLVVTPPRDGDRLLTPSLGHSDEAPMASVAPRPTRASLRAAAARRRRVLLILVSLTALVGVVSAFGVLPAWAIAVPLTLIVVFLWMARRQVRLASDHYWQEAAETRPESSNVVRRPAVRVDISHGAERRSEDDEPTVVLTAEQLTAAAKALEQEIAYVIALETTEGASLWDPLPITLPTYVDKPAAARSYRTIDLDGPNTWSAGHSAADSKTAAERAPAEPTMPTTANDAGSETARVANA
jgi:hypothetical protein